jgi:hypothetical protein
MSLDHYSDTRLHEFVHKLNMYINEMEMTGTNTFVYLNGRTYTKDFIMKMHDHVLHQLLVRECNDYGCIDLPCQDFKNLL